MDENCIASIFWTFFSNEFLSWVPSEDSIPKKDFSKKEDKPLELLLYSYTVEDNTFLSIFDVKKKTKRIIFKQPLDSFSPFSNGFVFSYGFSLFYYDLTSKEKELLFIGEEKFFSEGEKTIGPIQTLGDKIVFSSGPVFMYDYKSKMYKVIDNSFFRPLSFFYFHNFSMLFSSSKVKGFNNGSPLFLQDFLNGDVKILFEEKHPIKQASVFKDNIVYIFDSEDEDFISSYNVHTNRKKVLLKEEKPINSIYVLNNTLIFSSGSSVFSYDFDSEEKKFLFKEKGIVNSVFPFYTK